MTFSAAAICDSNRFSFSARSLRALEPFISQEFQLMFSAIMITKPQQVVVTFFVVSIDTDLEEHFTDLRKTPRFLLCNPLQSLL